MGNRKTVKKLIVGVAVLAVLVFAVSPVYATENLLQSYPELNNISPGVPVGERGWGFVITGNGEYLSRMTLYAYNETATVSISVRGYLYNATGGLPASPYNPVDVTDVVDVNPGTTWAEFEFDFGDDVILVDEASYFIAVVDNGTNTGSARWYKGSGSGGVLISDDGWGDAWSGYGAQLIHYVYTDDELGGGDPYTPPGTSGTGNIDEIIEGLTSFMLPLVVLLLPAVLLMIFTRRTDKWLLLIGLAIGVGLGFYFNLVPVWLVFLVAVGLIGMAYSEVRRNG